MLSNCIWQLLNKNICFLFFPAANKCALARVLLPLFQFEAGRRLNKFEHLKASDKSLGEVKKKSFLSRILRPNFCSTTVFSSSDLCLRPA